jgi:HEAT repeat protein
LTGESNTSAADLARSLAQTGETVLLRSAAIVTLGETGTADDRELLDTFALSDNKQIAAAARLALQKMDAKAD